MLLVCGLPVFLFRGRYGYTRTNEVFLKHLSEPHEKHRALQTVANDNRRKTAIEL